MRILFLGLNYAPEQIGIAVYSTGLCQYLASRGHDVHAIVGKPYYPEWRTYDAYRGGLWKHSAEADVKLTRVAHYVPANPTGLGRLVHHATFGLLALWPMLKEARRFKPEVVVTIAPSLIAAPVARLAAWFAKARSWLHIQDFEVEAAFATGLVKSDRMVSRVGSRFEATVLGGFDRVSSISHEMCGKAEAKGVARNRVYEFRNWCDLDAIVPLERPSSYREKWHISTPHVALYSGNIANKQGIAILVEVASLLSARQDLTFVVCGNGPNRRSLEEAAAKLANIQFHDLQPMGELNELLGLATLHILPQKASAADLVLPSKLTNMLASGRPVIATAAPGSGLAREVEGCGRIVEPENPEAMASAIVELLDSPAEYEMVAKEARARAFANWDRRRVLGAFEDELASALRQSAELETAP